MYFHHRITDRLTFFFLSIVLLFTRLYSIALICRRNYRLSCWVDDAPRRTRQSLSRFYWWRSHNAIRSNLLIGTSLLQFGFSLFCISSFLTLLFSLPTIVKLFVTFMWSVKKFLVIFCLELFRRKYQIVVTWVLTLIRVPLAKFLCSHLLFLFGGDLYLTFDSSALEFKGFLPFELHLFVVGQVEQLNRICYQILLHFKIQWRICRKWRSMIYLNDPRLELFIKEDVKAENLETHRVLSVIWLTRLVCVG